MKIIILTKNNDFQKYFINTINKVYPISAVFIEESEKQNIGNRIKYHFRNGGYSVKNTLKHYLYKKKKKKILKSMYASKEERERLKQKIFKSGYNKLDLKCNIYKNENINSEYFQNIISQIKPDIILVFGTSIVRNTIINLAEVASINLHWGLSPYYRGGRTTIWPIYNDEPEYIGVTIHLLSQHIDGGSIITQERAKLTKNDNLSSIEYKLTKIGTELVIKTLNFYNKNGEIPSTKQNFQKGKLYLGKELTNIVLKEVASKLKNDFFNKHVPENKERLKKMELIKNV